MRVRPWVSIAGRAAVLHARSAPRSGALTTAGQAGLRPAAGKSDVDFDAVIRQVSRELNDYDKNIFRSETGLRTSLSILDDLWRTVRYHATGTDRDAVKARETAALVAVDRWVKESALRRRETRGMHWRTDHPEADPAWTHRITVGGLDAVWTRDKPAGERGRVIELVLSKRCIECDKCVQICPTDVFDAVPGAPPVIARQSDCQTCFMCELYCPVDALYVDPDCHRPVDTRESEITKTDWPEQYRRDSGWGRARRTHPNESWRMGEIFAAARDILQEDTR